MRIALKRRHTSAAGATHPTVSALPVVEAGDALSRFSMQQVWRAALRAYCVQPVTFALFSVIGFAAATLSGMAVSALAGGDRLSDYLHATGPFPTYSALGKIEINPANPLFLLLLSQSLLGWILGAFSCGVISHAVLCRQGAWAACRAAARQLPALLAVTFLSSLLMGFGAVGINAGLRSVALDLSNVGANAITPQGMLQKATIHAIDRSLPAVGSPFAEFVPYLRNMAFNDLQAAPDYNAMLTLTYSLPNVSPAQPDTDEAQKQRVQLLTLASALAMLAAQSLLCFGSPAALVANGWIAALVRSAGWGARHLLPIILHRTAVFVALAGIKILFIILPSIVVQCLLRPQQWMPELTDTPIMLFSVMTITVVNALFAGFIVVHATTLYTHLTKAGA